MNDYTKISTEEVILEKIQFEVARILNRDFFDVKFVNHIMHELKNSMCVHLSASVMGKKIDTIKINYPLNWKESFKERWFPQWALKKWPVKRKYHEIDFHELYPDIKPSIPGKRMVIHVAHNDYPYVSP